MLNERPQNIVPFLKGKLEVSYAALSRSSPPPAKDYADQDTQDKSHQSERFVGKVAPKIISQVLRQVRLPFHQGYENKNNDSDRYQEAGEPIEENVRERYSDNRRQNKNSQIHGVEFH
jgi:hypothetical protein